MATISGGIFNFSEGGYIPPTWSGGETYNFSAYNLLYQIYADGTYIHVATNVGLEIYNLDELKIAYINYPEGFKTVGGNQNRIYLGTTNSGIKYINYTCISGSVTSPYDLSTCLNSLNTPRISSTVIKYLHVNGNSLSICTEAGVDYFRFNTNPEIHSRTFISGAKKCFTIDKTLYYTVSGIDSTSSGYSYSLNRVNNCLADWSEPDKSYITGSGIFQEGIKLTDIYITEGTAKNGGNTIFCATTSGAYVIDEDTQEYAIYYTRN